MPTSASDSRLGRVDPAHGRAAAQQDHDAERGQERLPQQLSAHAPAGARAGVRRPLAIAVVAREHLRDVAARLRERDAREEGVVGRRRRQARPQLRLPRARVVGGGRLQQVPVEVALQVAQVLRAERDHALGIVEVLALDLESCRASAHLARGGQDDLQEPRAAAASGRAIEPRLLAHDGEHQVGVGPEAPRIFADPARVVARIEQPRTSAAAAPAGSSEGSAPATSSAARMEARRAIAPAQQVRARQRGLAPPPGKSAGTPSAASSKRPSARSVSVRVSVRPDPPRDAAAAAHAARAPTRSREPPRRPRAAARAPRPGTGTATERTASVSSRRDVTQIAPRAGGLGGGGQRRRALVRRTRERTRQARLREASERRHGRRTQEREVRVHRPPRIERLQRARRPVLALRARHARRRRRDERRVGGPRVAAHDRGGRVGDGGLAELARAAGAAQGRELGCGGREALLARVQADELEADEARARGLGRGRRSARRPRVARAGGRGAAPSARTSSASAPCRRRPAGPRGPRGTGSGARLGVGAWTRPGRRCAARPRSPPRRSAPRPIEKSRSSRRAGSSDAAAARSATAGRTGRWMRADSPTRTRSSAVSQRERRGTSSASRRSAASSPALSRSTRCRPTPRGRPCRAPAGSPTRSASMLRRGPASPARRDGPRKDAEPAASRAATSAADCSAIASPT